jgi:hypothetical protein
METTRAHVEAGTEELSSKHCLITMNQNHCPNLMSEKRSRDWGSVLGLSEVSAAMLELALDTSKSERG